MVSMVEEGRISGYQYAILEIEPGKYLWWIERPGGTACWRGNRHPFPTTIEEAKDQISETMAEYGIGPTTNGD